MNPKRATNAQRARNKARSTHTAIPVASHSTLQPSALPLFQSSGLLLIVILLIAFFFRVHDLGHTPLGAHYDESANAILSNEIAQGARPIFIRAYTGKEVGYFYLAAGLIRLIGQPLIAVRLTSAFIGVFSVALTWRLARELFARERFAPAGEAKSAQIALLAAAIQAVNLWAITVSRLGFRAVLQPPLQALTVLYVYRALRSEGRRAWRNWALAGLWCGLSAYSYLAIRAFPILLGLFFLWIVAFVPDRLVPVGSERPFGRRPLAGRQPFTGRGPLAGRMRRMAQIALLTGVAALVFAPLGLFYVRNPEFFATRMGQVSVFADEVGGGDPWGALWHATRVSFGMFVARGDMNWRFNVAGAPVFWFPLGLFFVLGLAIGLWRLVRPAHKDALDSSWCGTKDIAPSPRPRGRSTVQHDALNTPEMGAPSVSHRARAMQRATYWLLLLWLPIMLLPSILGGGDVEVSLSLRAIGVMPALYFWPALGLVESASMLRRLLARRFSATVGRQPAAGRTTSVGLALLLIATGVYTYVQCFYVWGPSVPGYYVASGYLVEAADYLDAHLPPNADVYVSAEHYRHPTMALLARRYADIRWLIGPNVWVYPTASERETWYLFTHEAMPPRDILDRAFGAPYYERLAPDGQPAFLVYRFKPGETPLPQPAHMGAANLGNTLAYLGYDLNAPLVSGGVLDVTLYWRVLAPVDRDDWAFFAHLVDQQGFQWGGETFFTYPSGQWRAGEILAFHTTFPTWAGAPPGTYALSLGAFSSSLGVRLPALTRGAQGTWQMAGTTVQAGPLTLGRALSLPQELPPIQQPLEARFGENLVLLGSDRDRSDLRPGETLALSLYWQAEGQIDEAQTVSLWLEKKDAMIPLWQGSPAQGRYPFARWQPPEFVRDRYALRLPLEASAGDYELRLALLDKQGKTTKVVVTSPTADGVEGSERDLSPSLALGTIHVHASDRLWEPPAFEHAVGAQLGESVELVGYDLVLPGDGGPIHAGETLRLALVWRCLREMKVSYTVFTHLLDEGQQIRGQQDNPPLRGAYPTTLWVPGEVVVDEYDLVVQPGAPYGTYLIEVGMYDPATVQRLPVLDPTGEVGDRVLLGNVEIGELGE